MEKLWLTPEDQLTLDPYGINYATVRGRMSCKEWHPEPLSKLLRITPEEILTRYTRLANTLRCSRHEPYWEYNLSHLNKWGRQGGVVPFPEVEPILRELYERAQFRYESLPSAARTGQQFFLRAIRQRVDRVGKPQYVPSKMYPTQAGLPTGKRKGSFDAETQGAHPFRHVYPARYGTRHMRNSPRVIFEDSVQNCRWVEPMLSAVRNWLRDQFPEWFNGWSNPNLFTARYATDCVQGGGWSVETDYKKMDRHVRLQFVREFVYPVYEILLDPSDFISFQRYCEEAFSQPLYMGDYLLVGEHTLFSGQPITNDFETLITVQLGLGSVLETQIPSKLVKLLAIGDDLALLLSRVSESDARAVMHLFIETAEAVGLEMSRDKCGMQRGVVHFCRKVYYPAGRKNPETGYLFGAYPGLLCLNNIVQPEHPYEVAADEVIPCLQRLDGLIGSPDYFPVVQMISRFSVCPLLSEATRSNAKFVDWWERLYGEEWNPSKSPTLRWLDETLSGS